MFTVIKTRPLFLWFLLMFGVLSAEADSLVVIAHPNSGISYFKRSELVNLYMGRTKKLPSGITALPIDLPNNFNQKESFYRQLVDKPLPEIQAYWARLLFTGQATPPQQADSVNEVLDLVSHNQGAIAYINRSRVKPSVKIVFEFKP
jgi:hypothetical protein